MSKSFARKLLLKATVLRNTALSFSVSVSDVSPDWKINIRVCGCLFFLLKLLVFFCFLSFPLSFSIIHRASILWVKRASTCQSLSDLKLLCSCHILFMTNLGNSLTVEVSTWVFNVDVQRFWQLFWAKWARRIFPPQPKNVKRIRKRLMGERFWHLMRKITLNCQGVRSHFISFSVDVNKFPNHQFFCVTFNVLEICCCYRTFHTTLDFHQDVNLNVKH